MDENKVREIIRDENEKARFNTNNTVFHTHNNIDAPFIPFLNISSAPNYFCVASTTNGTTPTAVFGSNGAQFNLTVTGCFLISLDTTAGNILVKNKGNTIATVAKGTTAGALVGATALSTGTLASYIKGDSFTVESSSAGNATVFLSFTSS